MWALFSIIIYIDNCDTFTKIMPGISLRCRLDKTNTIDDDNYGSNLLLEASKSILHSDYYQREILLNTPYLVICTRYPEYPIKILNNNKFWACLEGKIYGKNESSIESEIIRLTEILFNNDLTMDTDKKKIADWLLETDGDFVLYVLNKDTNDFFIMNDLLGRLPLYYRVKDGTELMVSREIQFFSYLTRNNYQNDNKFDMMGIAQFLLFSHTLGKRTLLNNVCKLEPASLLSLQKLNSRIETHNVFVYNFEEKSHAGEGIENNARELVPLFLDACKNRVDKSAKNVVSLSGGLDSRAIAASLRSNKITCFAVTSPEPVWRPVVGNLSETDIAKKVARVLNIECQDYDIMIPKDSDLVTLLTMKNGLIYLAHSFLPKFLQKIKNKHELTPVNFFTGHGGDIAFANLSFNVRDVESWARSILRVKGRLPICQVAELTRINETEIINELKNILTTYPEKDLSLKNAHFLFFENNAKFSFEIEDVNRFYFWSVAPFYSVPFFKYIFSCSDKDKEKLELYREFLLALSPAVASIKISNWSCSIISKKFKILQTILTLSFKHRNLRNFIKKIYNKRAYYYQKDARIIECIREQVKDCPQISNLLTVSTIEKILDNSSRYDHEGIDNLFTIASVLQDAYCSRSTINKYF